MGNLDWENVKGDQKKSASQAPKTEGKLESPYRKGEDSGLDPKENHKAHDAIAGDEADGGEHSQGTDAPRSSTQ